MPLKICKLDAEDEVVAELASGSHVIGRGPILKCSDKRISRNHATIDVKKDHATITPIHINPCYHMAANSKTVRILPHQQDTFLQDGDKFGLLPDACWFKVKCEPDDESKEIQGDSPMKRMCEEESDESDCKRIKLEEESTGSASREETVDGPSIKEETDEGTMLVKEEDGTTSDSNKISETGEVKEEEIDVSENYVKQEDTGDDKVDSENIEHNIMKQENTEDNEVRRESTEDDQVKQENTEASEVEQGGIEDSEVKQENAQGNKVEPGNEKLDPGPSTSSSNQDPKDEDEKDKAKDTKDQATGTESPKLKREKCWYGASCYRKNPAHRADLRHPGDSDYLSDSDDDRPVCIFGAQCYRKNKQHRQSYKHPPRQRPPKYGRGQRRRDNGNLANPNDDFIDSDDDDLLGDFSDGSSDNYEPPSDADSDETDWTSSQDVNSQDLANGKKTKK